MVICNPHQNTSSQKLSENDNYLGAKVKRIADQVQINKHACV